MEDKIYQIFVSSTFKDLEQERQEVLAAVVETGNMPVGMEYFPSTSATPFDYIKTMLEKVDYYILILAGKYGSIEQESGLSYTELEFDYAQELGIPTMVFLHKDISRLPMSSNETDPDIVAKLKNFRSKASSTLAKMWSNSSELKSQVLLSIPHIIKQYPRLGWIRADSSQYEPDVFDYSQIAYQTSVNDPFMWDINHLGETFCSKNITWQELVIKIFPSLQSFLTKYELQREIKGKCGDIVDKDFERIFIQLQRQNLIKQEVITYPEGGGDVCFCLTAKGVRTLLRLAEDSEEEQ